MLLRLRAVEMTARACARAVLFVGGRPAYVLLKVVTQTPGAKTCRQLTLPSSCCSAAKVSPRCSTWSGGQALTASRLECSAASSPDTSSRPGRPPCREHSRQHEHMAAWCEQGLVFDGPAHHSWSRLSHSGVPKLDGGISAPRRRLNRAAPQHPNPQALLEHRHDLGVRLLTCRQRMKKGAKLRFSRMPS